MSSPVASSGTKASVSFEDLWRQLGECHQNALQELEAKVAKLKKERCLDAQRLEVFFNRNQQLKEQNKNLQDTISSLEERLRAGECERCAILEDNLKSNQGQNTHLINKLKQERKAFEDENGRLNTELENLKKVCSDLRASSPEPDDCFIPDSPVMPSSLPAANKLKKRKNVQKSKFVRYAERPLPAAQSSLFIEAEKDKDDHLHNPGKAEVLVPNTCELDASPINDDLNPEEVIAETCRLDIVPHRMKKIVNQQHRTETSFRSEFCMKPYPLVSHSPDSTTDRSPSLLPRTKRFSNDSLIHKAKRKKEESQLKAEEKPELYEENMGKKKASQSMQFKLEEQSALEQSFKAGNKQSQSDPDETLIEKPNRSFASPVFKKPNATVKQMTQKENTGKKRTPVKNRNNSMRQLDVEDSLREFKVEPMWSIDPALALDMYESEQGADVDKDENHCPGESVDTDCTWISHSVLQRQAEHVKKEVSCLGDKANDSLDRMFDTSACGEYKSYNTSHMDQDQQSDEDEEEEDDEDDDNEDEADNSMNQRKPGQPAFAHVAVIRNKEERRKLKGTTCKECEIYYAHLPEEERQKKLSNCSRHRFLYIPPCTPENFWEVGFPSTQTCIERGYIHEEKNPEGRMRRRQPFNALFSPKRNKQKK